MNFHIITIFPNIFDSYFKESIIARAEKNHIIKIHVHDLRKWTKDKHKTVDDPPYGGGAGMIMKVEPVYKAISELRQKNKNQKVLLFSAKGKKWTQAQAKSFSEVEDIIMICPRYEGVDERVLEFVDQEVSIGDYVLTGGEIGAMVVLDSISRLLPGVLGNKESLIQESHNAPGFLECPQYTRPEVFEAEGKEYNVPEILLSGHHKNIKEWQEKNCTKNEIQN